MSVQTYNISSAGKLYRAEEYIFIGGGDRYSNQNIELIPPNPKPCSAAFRNVTNHIEGSRKERNHNDMHQVSSPNKKHVITIDYSYLLQQKSVHDLRRNCCAFL